MLVSRLHETTIGMRLLDALYAMIAREVSSAGTLFMTMWSVAIGILATIVGGIFLAAQPALYRAGLLQLFPGTARDRAAATLDSCGGALRLWLLGQLAGMVIVGALTGFGVWLVGLPSPIALGVLAGLLEFIPYAGPILMAIPALLIAATMDMRTVLETLAVFVAVQQLEGHLIMPLIWRRAVLLPPALTLFALFAMGLVFGPLGVLLAAPLTVVAYVSVKEIFVRGLLGEQTVIPGEPPASHGGTGG
jgi:predicted PurR-regulated permease PerM